MASLCAAVMRGISKPLVESAMSTAALLSGVIVPIPICAWVMNDNKANKIRAAVFLAVFFIDGFFSRIEF